MTRVTLCTANTPGAVAILQLHGEDLAEVLSRLTGRAAWPQRRAMLCQFADIDEGLAILLTPQSAQLMPHGGPRVVQKLIEYLTATLGCAYDPTPNPQEIYPEARSPIEADMLDAVARAASPAAIDLLAAQPALWRALLKPPLSDGYTRQLIANRAERLNWLITPPTVVVIGPPNAGKSTLTNALMGKSMSIVTDLPGTTRDWVGGLVELSAWGFSDQVAVQWLDTPGIHNSMDVVEQQAIRLAQQQIKQADILITMRGLEQDWLDTADLPREPELWVVNKADDTLDSDRLRIQTSAENPLHISAQSGNGLAQLGHAVVVYLGLLWSSPELWAFSSKLLSWSKTGDNEALKRYLGL